MNSVTIRSIFLFLTLFLGLHVSQIWAEPQEPQTTAVQEESLGDKFLSFFTHSIPRYFSGICSGSACGGGDRNGRQTRTTAAGDEKVGNPTAVTDVPAVTDDAGLSAEEEEEERQALRILEEANRKKSYEAMLEYLKQHLKAQQALLNYSVGRFLIKLDEKASQAEESKAPPSPDIVGTTVDTTSAVEQPTSLPRGVTATDRALAQLMLRAIKHHKELEAECQSTTCASRRRVLEQNIVVLNTFLVAAARESTKPKDQMSAVELTQRYHLMMGRSVPAPQSINVSDKSGIKPPQAVTIDATSSDNQPQ
jgi:hypothetical protein